MGAAKRAACWGVSKGGRGRLCRQRRTQHIPRAPSGTHGCQRARPPPPHPGWLAMENRLTVVDCPPMHSINSSNAWTARCESRPGQTSAPTLPCPPHPPTLYTASTNASSCWVPGAASTVCVRLDRPPKVAGKLMARAWGGERRGKGPGAGSGGLVEVHRPAQWSMPPLNRLAPAQVRLEACCPLRPGLLVEHRGGCGHAAPAALGLYLNQPVTLQYNYTRDGLAAPAAGPAGCPAR